MSYLHVHAATGLLLGKAAMINPKTLRMTNNEGYLHVHLPSRLVCLAATGLVLGKQP